VWISSSRDRTRGPECRPVAAMTMLRWTRSFGPLQRVPIERHTRKQQSRRLTRLIPHAFLGRGFNPVQPRPRKACDVQSKAALRVRASCARQHPCCCRCAVRALASPNSPVASEAGPWAGTCSRLRHAAQRGGAQVRGRLRDLLASEAGPWAGTCSRLRHAAQRGGAQVRGRLRDLLADTMARFTNKDAQLGFDPGAGVARFRST
jgi:hypothetical protein